MMHAGFVEIPACWVCGSSSFAREHDAILDLEVYRDQHPALAEYSGETVWFCRCSGCGFTQPERVPALTDFELVDAVRAERQRAAFAAIAFGQPAAGGVAVAQ